MDFSQFTQDNFDAKEWVNAAFKNQADVPADQHATTLVMKLQMFIQEVNNVVDTSCQETVANLPRIVRELDAVRQEASLLNEHLKTVKHDIERVETNTAEGMKTLVTLDALKTRMQSASDALQEADNWTNLSADVEEVFSSGDANLMAQKLVGMQQSLEVLSDVPDFAHRHRFLDDLKNRLEALLSTNIVSAFTSDDTEKVTEFYEIFKQIDREPQLFAYYQKCRKSLLLQSWKETLDKNDTFLEAISTYYDNLLSTFHTQIAWCSNIFPKPVTMVTLLIADTVTSLDPSLEKSIGQHLGYDNARFEDVIALKRVTDRLRNGLDAAISGRNDDVYSKDAIKLVTAMYYPFRTHVTSYGDREEDAMRAELEKIQLDGDDAMESVRLLGESVSKVFAHARKASERCLVLTDGCGYAMLATAINSYFTSYTVEFQRVLVNCREKSSLNMCTLDTHDWSQFQQALRLVQVCGELLHNLEDLDQQLVNGIVDSLVKLLVPSSPVKHSPRSQNPFRDSPNLLLDRLEDKKNLYELVESLHSGSLPMVLQESKDQFEELAHKVAQFAFDVVFAALQNQLEVIPKLECWRLETTGGAITADLPSFSTPPQEYTTKIGQYLMTIPQQLEAYNLQDNPALSTGLKHAKLPYMTPTEQATCLSLAEIWLTSVAMGTCHHYVENVLKINETSFSGNQQLKADLDYFVNVLEDLELQPTDSLKELRDLIATPSDTFSKNVIGKTSRILSIVAQMRKLDLT